MHKTIGVKRKMGVYIITEKNQKSLYKIGFTNNIDARLATLQTGNSSRIYLLKFWKDGSRQMEKDLHEKYKSQRQIGEFFSLSDVDLENILKLHPSDKEEWLNYEKDMPWVLKS